jgi:hypothetical protein
MVTQLAVEAESFQKLGIIKKGDGATLQAMSHIAFLTFKNAGLFST